MHKLLTVSLFAGMLAVLMAPGPVANDHIGAYNFVVEIDGVSAGAFTEVSGLTTEVQLKDGGATFTMTRNLLSKSPVFDTWWDALKGGKQADARTITVTLTLDGAPVAQWDALKAKPVGRRVELRKVNGGYAPLEHVRFKSAEVLRTLKPPLPTPGK
jgi:hypothetical protein